MPVVFLKDQDARFKMNHNWINKGHFVHRGVTELAVQSGDDLSNIYAKFVK